MKQHELDDIIQQANECHRKTVFQNFFLGKSKPDFFGISDEHMQLLSLEGGRIQSKMLDNYLRLVFSFYPQKIDI